MPSRCVAGFCSHSRKDGVSLFKFPKDPDLRLKWVKQVRRTREKWIPSHSSLLCSEHFELNCFDPSPTIKESLQCLVQHKRLLLPGAVPTVFWRTERQSGVSQGLADTNRNRNSAQEPRSCVRKRLKIQVLSEAIAEYEDRVAVQAAEEPTQPSRDMSRQVDFRKTQTRNPSAGVRPTGKTKAETLTRDYEEKTYRPHIDHDYFAPPPSLFRDRAMQCCGPQMHKDLLRDDRLSRLYTGLPLHQFMLLSDELLKDYVNESFPLDARDQLLMTFMKLRLNLLQDDLAERFHVPPSVVGTVLTVWLDLMAERMKGFIPWLPREKILATMPEFFKENYPAATCVIDSFEVSLSKPLELETREGPCYHHYDQRTFKYLLAMAPSGLVMFVSAGYREKCSGRFMTSDSGFLKFLKPGDVVVADRGFLISDLLQERKAQLHVPALKTSVEESTVIENVRLPVKKAVCRLKNFRILTQKVPFNLVHKCDRILSVCVALCNLQGDIVHDEQKDS